MKNLISTTIVILLLSISGLYAQGGGRWAANSPYMKMYDLATVETINGEVVSVDKIAPTKGNSPYGIHFLVKTSNETIPVHLGPGWFIENQEEQFTSKDNVVITGSRITYEGAPAIIAAEVKRGDATLILRDKNGLPTWNGWKRRK